MNSLFKFGILVVCVIIISVDAQKNERQLASNIPCISDSQCVPNSICLGNTPSKSGICFCLDKFFPKINGSYYECLPELKDILNDSCKDNIQCEAAFTNFAECKEQKCVCKHGSHMMNNKCHETVKLGDICKSHQNCLLKGNKLAACLDGRCQCAYNEHPVINIDGQTCEPNSVIGQECTNDNQCIVNNTRCYGTCRCQLGYTVSSNQTMCLKEGRKLYDTCEEDGQCENISPFAVCKDSFCRCTTNYHTYKGQCYKNARLNGTCESAVECYVIPELEEYLECKDGICVCRSKYIAANVKICRNNAYRRISFKILIFISIGLHLYFKIR